MRVDMDWLTREFPHLSQIKSLSSGGQKWVFECEHPTLGSSVLKLIKPGAEYRTDRELEAVRRISSNSVPRIYELGQINSQMGSLVWFLEQRVKGLTLSEKLRQGPLNGKQVLTLGRSLLAAAVDAEAVKMVHRDIKPDNVIIDSNNDAWLLDFGIVRILDLDSKTQTNAAFGPHTPGYGAPEQIRNRKDEIDGRTDLFAIGVVLYESASGVNPFLSGARDQMEVLRRVENLVLQPLNLSWDNNGLFSDFVQALTQKYRYQRPATCLEAQEWLNDVIARIGGI